MSQQQNQAHAPVTDSVEDTGMILPPITSNDDYENDPKVRLKRRARRRTSPWSLGGFSASAQPSCGTLDEFNHPQLTSYIYIFVGMGSHCRWRWSGWLGFRIRTGQAWEASPSG